jgi:excisionase family DNA binding protein
MVEYISENKRGKTSQVSFPSNEVKNTPVFTLTIEQLEPLIKSWIKDCLDYGPVSQTVNLPKYLTRFEAAKLLQISLVTLHSYTKLGLIPAKRIGSRVLYSEDELHSALNEIPTRLSRR